jgi:hypothetical protein
MGERPAVVISTPFFDLKTKRATASSMAGTKRTRSCSPAALPPSNPPRGWRLVQAKGFFEARIPRS